MIAAASRTATWTALFLAFAMAAVVLSALGFEHIGGYIPCALCLEQRLPYYIGAPLMLATFLLGRFGSPALLVRLLLAAGAGLMLWGLVLAVYHSGVEWHFWAGPTDCTSVAPVTPGSVEELLSGAVNKRPPSCDEAALRVLGLSMAGWNALASAFLAAVAIRGVFAKR
ncbi:disulfide bond formation protein B [Zhengella mangrovi]|uniref:Disulfide bond formation protein B n=1 Tax=Zhengella mangrovi TaxID=1982044 RepID=A0A2G1QJ45_9HYPH|nr:disulfide bond formation protein B [Zhengella mangrovi]PHP65567.1 disulfide bond formation protein B [Zhengella mangrovi]